MKFLSFLQENINIKKYLLALLCTLFYGSYCPTALGQSSLRLADVLLSHKAGLALLTSLEADMLTEKVTPIRQLINKGRFAFDRERVVIHCGEPGKATIDTLIFGNESRSLSSRWTPNGKVAQTGSILPSHASIGFSDLRTQLLLQISDANGRLVSLSEFFETYTHPVSVVRLGSGDDQVIRIICTETVNAADYERIYTLVPKRNYMIQSCIFGSVNSSSLEKTEVSIEDFSELKPGVNVPIL